MAYCYGWQRWWQQRSRQRETGHGSCYTTSVFRPPTTLGHRRWPGWTAWPPHLSAQALRRCRQEESSQKSCSSSDDVTLFCGTYECQEAAARCYSCFLFLLIWTFVANSDSCWKRKDVKKCLVNAFCCFTLLNTSAGRRAKAVLTFWRLLVSNCIPEYCHTRFFSKMFIMGHCCLLQHP